MSNLWRYPKRKEKLHWQEPVIALAILALILFCFAVLPSCNTPSKATNYLKDKGKLAGVCAEAYPVHDSVIVRDSIQYDTLYIPDEIQMAADTIYVEGKAIPFFAKCPPAMVITKTVTKDSIIIQTDVAELAVMKQQRDDLIVNNKDLVKDRDYYKIKAKNSGLQKWITWILLVVGFVCGFILKMKKIF